MVVLAGCGMIGTCLGLGVNVAGLFFTSIANDFAIGRGSVAATLTVYNLVHAFTGMAAPRLLLKNGLKKTVITGTVLQAAGTLALAFCSNVFLMMLVNGVRGFAAGLTGTVTVTIMINYWFNQKKALMTSIAMGFSGLVSALLSPFLSGLIQSAGWRTGYMALAAMVLLFNLPAIILPITLKPEEKNMVPYGGKAVQAAKENNAGGSEEAVSRSMFAVLLIYTACAAGCAALPQHFSGIAESYQLAAAGAYMVSACMISNTAGKIVLGSLIDRIGAKLSTTFYAIVIAAGAALLIISRSSGILIGAAAMYGLCYSMGTVGIAMLAREMFPASQYSRVYPKLALGTTLSNAVFNILIGSLYDLNGSYTLIICMLACMIMVSLVMVQLAYRMKKV